jgi:hypothetical protein
MAQDKPIEALSDLARQRIAEGTPRDELLAELQRFVAALDAQECLDEADIVLEVMDFLVGFCSPGQAI